MQRYSLSVALLGMAALFLACQSKALQMIIEPQELHNYTATEKVTCTSPKMIDGDVKTRGYVDGRWIYVTLPDRKAVHRLIFRKTNITDAVVYQKLEGEKRWRLIQRIWDNQSPVIDLRLHIVTEGLRIYISGTTDDKRKPPQYDPKRGEFRRQTTLGRAFAHEIEIYGLVSKEKE